MTYTLVADGSSDVVLVPILTWCLKQHGVTPIVSQPADLARIPRRSTEHRLRAVLDLYPCDILFVHRDAEGQCPLNRRAEIAHSLGWATIHHVAVVPVRMTEAWLLINEGAIRSAAGNPNGTVPLNLPNRDLIERMPDPKQVLFDALRTASGLNTRRRARFPVHKRVHRIPDYIQDYTPLTALQAFQQLQIDIDQAVHICRVA